MGEDGAYVLAVERSKGVVEEIPGCPGLKLDIDALWSKADELGDEVSE